MSRESKGGAKRANMYCGVQFDLVVDDGGERTTCSVTMRAFNMFGDWTVRLSKNKGKRGRNHAAAHCFSGQCTVLRKELAGA